MALFIDGAVSTVSDLQALDSAILETARVEGIDLTKKLQVAKDAMEIEIAIFLLKTSGSGSDYDLKRVVVTNGLHRWHALRTLAEVYGDAYNSQLNDRYLGKWEQYLKAAREAALLLFEYGIGMVQNPVPKAADPVVTGVPGGSIPQTYYVQVCWRNSMGQSGAPSDPVPFDATNSELPVVDAGPAPAGAIGFDVFAGLTPASIGLQNAAPVAVGSAWTMPGTGLVNGQGPGAGQTPEYYVRRQRSF